MGARHQRVSRKVLVTVMLDAALQLDLRNLSRCPRGGGGQLRGGPQVGLIPSSEMIEKLPPCSSWYANSSFKEWFGEHFLEWQTT